VGYPGYEFLATASVALRLRHRGGAVPLPAERAEPVAPAAGLVDDRAVWLRPPFVVGAVELPVVNAPAPVRAWTARTPAAAWPPASASSLSRDRGA